jgi:diguanylate cyclase (GGDEF)-like protein/PAS domain S-box-containing protein
LNAWLEPAGHVESNSNVQPSSIATRRVAILFLFFVLIAPLSGMLVFKLYGTEVKREAFVNLEAIAEIKANQIEDWLDERQHDAVTLKSSKEFAELIQQFLHHNVQYTKTISERFKTIRLEANYDSVLLLNTSNQLLLSLGEHTELTPDLQDKLQQVIALNQIQRGNFYRDGTGFIHLDWIVPISIGDGKDAHTIAAVVLRITAQNFLFPLINKWPTASPSGETILMRCEEERQIYLNDLLHLKNSALTALKPADDSILPSSAVLASTSAGIKEGKDYRGQAVLAVYRNIMGTDWHLVAKIDHDEVFLPLKRLVLWVSLVAFFASVSLSAALLLIWRQQRQMQKMQLLAEQAKTDRLLHKFFDLPFIGMGMASPTTTRWLRFNNYLCSIFGYSREEFSQKTWEELTHPEDLNESKRLFNQLTDEGVDGFTVDQRFIRKDGAIVFACVDVKCVRAADGKIDYLLATVQDITSRKINEAKLHRLTQIYSALSQCSLATVRCANEQELFQQICMDAINFGEMQMAWIGIVDTGSKNVRPAASYGEGTDYLNDISITIDQDSPLGQGPTATAIFTHRPYWCQNFQNDPKTAPWHQKAADFGWGSSASLPIFKHDQVMGVLTLYASEVDAFDEAAQNLLIEMAKDISYALGRFALESERKQQEIEILNVKNQLQDTLDAIPDLLFDVGLDGHFYSFQSPRPDLLAAPVDAIIGNTISGLLPPNVAEIIMLALKTADSQGRSHGEQFELELPQGKVWFELSVSRKYSSSNQPRFIVLSRDITQRKQAEKHLRQYTERLEQAEKHVGLGSWEFTIDTDMVWWSKQMYQLFGFEYPAEIPSFSEFLEHIHPNDRQKLQDGYNKIIQGLAPDVPKDFRSNPKFGELRYFSPTLFFEANAQGKPNKFMGTVLDVTKIKQAETQLSLAAKVFEESNEGFIITDADVNILLVNRAFTDITGYSQAEVLAKNPRILQSGKHDREFYQGIWDALLTKGHWQGEIWNKRKSGEVFPMLESISAVMGDAENITHYVAVFADITEIKDSEARMEFIAHHDSLTGLPNRLLLFYRLGHAIDMAKREHKQLALLMLDLDRFKDVNDSFGHFAGDQLLQLVANRLISRLREVDTVARLGGDEFTVLLEDINHAEDAAKVAEIIIRDFNEPWELPGIGDVRIGVSIGISLFPEYGDSPEMLLQQADAALYLAKNKGRNRYSYFSEDLTTAARSRIELEAQLRRAISQNELRVYYQPQVDTYTGKIVSAEALVRWQHPTDGLIPPIRFISVAEATGIIDILGEWVLRETCRQGKAWQDAGFPVINLGVNVSPHQLRQTDMPALVARVLKETGFPAANLELELTESGLMDSDWDALDLLDSLRQHGVRLAIDDFGTGYSSLAYLKLFPIDILKIDKSFIDDIPFLKDDMEITAAIVAMGHNLGFKILAEGVETEEQLFFLRTQGCDLYQGYLISPPLPAEEFITLLLADSADNIA